MVTQMDQTRALSLSTFAFTVCFAIWTIFSILGIQIKENLGLNDTQFGILVATPVLTGSLSRLPLGDLDGSVWRAGCDDLDDVCFCGGDVSVILGANLRNVFGGGAWSWTGWREFCGWDCVCVAMV